MMLDPILRLALAIHSSKGVYALLLGSGVSRSSAIPTGWEVVLDLIRKLAALKGQPSDPDPEAWYKALTGSDPDYSDILDQVTSSSAERRQLLRSYFEPSEEDREQGRKSPSPAHRAIARLVAKGYIHVIVTTNFDRLMEQALVDAGVQAHSHQHDRRGAGRDAVDALALHGGQGPRRLPRSPPPEYESRAFGLRKAIRCPAGPRVR